MAIDPLADKYPGWTPYNYTKDNPLKYIDPDGKESLFPDGMPDPMGELKNSVNLMAYQAKTSVDNFVSKAVPIVAEVVGYAGIVLTGVGIATANPPTIAAGGYLSTAGSGASAVVNLAQYFETKDNTKLWNTGISLVNVALGATGQAIIKGALSSSIASNVLSSSVLQGVNNLYWDAAAFSASQVVNAEDKKKATPKKESYKKKENK